MVISNASIKSLVQSKKEKERKSGAVSGLMETVAQETNV